MAASVCQAFYTQNDHISADLEENAILTIKANSDT